MSGRLVCADSLRRFVNQAFVRLDYPQDQAVDAADVLMWASLRGVDTHGVRNLKSYYVDRTIEGLLRPQSEIRVELNTPLSACLDGDSGLGLACACRAMRMAIEKSRNFGIGMVCVRNTHHLGPAGYFAHMAVEHGMLGLCATGHFFGKGHIIGVAPLGSFLPMFSTNPLSFAAPCGRHAPFVLDMSTSITTVNRIEMHAQEGRPIPPDWACDASGNPTTDPTTARVLMPLGGTAELGGYKGAGLAMMVSVLSSVLSGGWAAVERTQADATMSDPQMDQYDQASMGHVFAAVQVEAFRSLADFRSAMDAMIDAFHAAPVASPSGKLCYPGEIEFDTAAERTKYGIPINVKLFEELQTMAKLFGLEEPQRI
jgi:LDH2 family malate/lactate/ureidoglycolate dehydrogenase